MFDDPIAMLLALIRASNPMMTKIALAGVVEYLTSDFEELDSETVLDVMAQCLSQGFSVIVQNDLTPEEKIARFREQLGFDDEGGLENEP